MKAVLPRVNIFAVALVSWMPLVFVLLIKQTECAMQLSVNKAL